MVDIVYKPTSPYNTEINTPPSKTPIESSIKLYGIKKMLYGVVSEDNMSTTKTANLYTSKEGTTLFVTNVEIQLYTYRQSKGWITIGQETFIYLHGGGVVDDYTSTQKSIIFNNSFPVVDNIDISVRCLSSSGNVQYTTVTIVGYEVDNSLLQSFY